MQLRLVAWWPMKPLMSHDQACLFQNEEERDRCCHNALERYLLEGSRVLKKCIKWHIRQADRKSCVLQRVTMCIYRSKSGRCIEGAIVTAELNCAVQALYQWICEVLWARPMSVLWASGGNRTMKILARIIGPDYWMYEGTVISYE